MRTGRDGTGPPTDRPRTTVYYYFLHSLCKKMGTSVTSAPPTTGVAGRFIVVVGAMVRMTIRWDLREQDCGVECSNSVG